MITVPALTGEVIVISLTASMAAKSFSFGMGPELRTGSIFELQAARQDGGGKRAHRGLYLLPRIEVAANANWK